MDLYHHRVAWVLSVSAFSVGLGYLLMSIAPTYFLILAALSLGSIGSAMWHPPALGLLARRFPRGGACSFRCTGRWEASGTPSAHWH